MAYLITDNEAGGSETLSESQAERKYGNGEFTMMVAGMRTRYDVVNLSGADANMDDMCGIDNDSCDISEAFS